MHEVLQKELDTLKLTKQPAASTWETNSRMVKAFYNRMYGVNVKTVFLGAVGKLAKRIISS